MAKSRLKGAFRLSADLLVGLVEAVEDEAGRDADVDEIIDRFRADKTLRREVARLLVNKSALSFLPWKTVILGNWKTSATVLSALESGGYRVSDWARDILAKAPLASEPRTLELVKVTMADLGFKRNATTPEIYVHARELGLGLCPPEVGPALRHQYHDQPMNEWIRVGMEPIADSDGNLHVYSVEHGADGRWLHACYADPTLVWRPGRHWVFVRSK